MKKNWHRDFTSFTHAKKLTMDHRYKCKIQNCKAPRRQYRRKSRTMDRAFGIVSLNIFYLVTVAKKMK
jgi:hypothetical protein